MAQTAEEHLAWCKHRALQYLDRGDLSSAVASMTSDLTKHPDTAAVGRGPVAALGVLAITGGPQEARRWIESFR